MPLEHRVFYKLISGLHTSISSHIAVGYLLDPLQGLWGIELDQYQRRVSRHPDRLHNLHFLYLLLLRAMDLMAPLLQSHSFATSASSSSGCCAEAKGAMRELLVSRHMWPLSFDQLQAFREHTQPSSSTAAPAAPAAASRVNRRVRGGAGGAVVASKARAQLYFGAQPLRMLEQLQRKFFNISRVMDCVGCQVHCSTAAHTTLRHSSVAKCHSSIHSVAQRYSSAHLSSGVGCGVSCK